MRRLYQQLLGVSNVRTPTSATRLLEGLAAGWIIVACLVRLLIRRVGRRHFLPTRRLLVLDTAYTLSGIRSKGIEHSITSRDLDGYFDHVWSVHPVAGADSGEPSASSVGGIVCEEMAARHTFIEGKVGRFEWGDRWPLLNFALAQSQLVRQLDVLIERERVGVIRAGDPYYLGLLGLLLKWLHRVPLVVRVNGNYDAIYESVGRLAYPRLFRTRRIEKRVERFVFPRVDLVAGANQNNMEYAIQNGARRERSTVFRYGSLIAPSHFQPPQARAESAPVVTEFQNRPFMICISRLEPVKHPEDTVAVLVEARESVEDLGLVLVGGGSMSDQLTDLTERLGLSGSVVFAGNRDQDWIARAFVESSIVLSPMTGRALVEAALSATPVVAYDVEWHGELIRDGETGLLVPYRDTSAMATAVVSLLKDPRWARHLGDSARAFTLEMMDPNRLMEHERRSYDALFAGSSLREVNPL